MRRPAALPGSRSTSPLEIRLHRAYWRRHKVATVAEAMGLSREIVAEA